MRTACGIFGEDCNDGRKCHAETDGVCSWRVNCSPSAVALYQGLREPRCNGGKGCAACWAKWETVQFPVPGPLTREEELRIKHGSPYKCWDSGEVTHVDDPYEGDGQ